VECRHHDVPAAHGWAGLRFGLHLSVCGPKNVAPAHERVLYCGRWRALGQAELWLGRWECWGRDAALLALPLACFHAPPADLPLLPPAPCRQVPVLGQRARLHAAAGVEVHPDRQDKLERARAARGGFQTVWSCAAECVRNCLWGCMWTPCVPPPVQPQLPSGRHRCCQAALCKPRCEAPTAHHALSPSLAAPQTQVSAPARDLLKAMLERNPAKRIRAADALRHPWLQARVMQLQTAMHAERNSQRQPLFAHVLRCCRFTIPSAITLCCRRTRTA